MVRRARQVSAKQDVLAKVSDLTCENLRLRRELAQWEHWYCTGFYKPTKLWLVSRAFDLSLNNKFVLTPQSIRGWSAAPLAPLATLLSMISARAFTSWPGMAVRPR